MAMAQEPWLPAVYLEAFRAYRDHSNREVARVRRNLTGLSDDDKASLVWKPDEQVKRMEDAVKANLSFLDQVAELVGQAPPPGAGRHDADVPAGIKPVQILLQTFVREWSAEGAAERGECFERLLGALEGHLKAQLQQAAASGSPPPRVLCPGAGLGRLPFEIQRRGYTCSACEGRVLHYFGQEFIRRHGSRREAHRIQPFALNTCNRFRAEDHVRETALPEVDVAEAALPPVQFGDFLRLYDSPAERAAFDAVITAFAVDTSPNIFRYVRTVAHAVRPGGLWANFGPLAYDTDHDEGHGHGIELSWEELRHAVSHFFEVQEECFVDALNAANGESMMQMQYSCVFFRAVRNEQPAPGIGAAK